MALPLGLHVHLLNHGGSLRFALWFEAPGEPDSFRAKGRAPREGPLPPPSIVPHSRRPACLARGLKPSRFIAVLPRLGNYRPVPLPGLV
ncbi:MAG: hypothetical protein KA978_24195, partial [Deltaproteobacteria bacterium]|nr:hypothetical protein [Deltaproteobacteria bacterium]